MAGLIFNKTLWILFSSLILVVMCLKCKLQKSENIIEINFSRSIKDTTKSFFFLDSTPYQIQILDDLVSELKESALFSTVERMVRY